MKLLLICTALNSWFHYDLKREIEPTTVSVSFNRVKSLTEYEQTTVNLDGKGNIKDAYVYVMDSPSLDTADKKFVISLNCKIKKCKKRGRPRSSSFFN